VDIVRTGPAADPSGASPWDWWPYRLRPRNWLAPLFMLIWFLHIPGHWTIVNGHLLYYETMGHGRPLLLLHGGGSSIRDSFARQIEPFSKRHAIIAPEQVGQGNTPDVAGALTYGAMADDTAELLRQLRARDVDVVGFSDGGIIALVLAVRHPELVRRLVVSGANFSPEGLPAADLRQMREREARTSTDVSTWTIERKLNHLWLTSPTPVELSSTLLASIRKPVLVMAGDHDAILAEHTVALSRLMPRARLWILPGTSHNTFGEHAEWVNPTILSFLDDGAGNHGEEVSTDRRERQRSAP
jgi:pimeloyl-ACP methyl ester carboxylesterase